MITAKTPILIPEQTVQAKSFPRLKVVSIQEMEFQGKTKIMLRLHRCTMEGTLMNEADVALINATLPSGAKKVSATVNVEIPDLDAAIAEEITEDADKALLGTARTGWLRALQKYARRQNLI